MAHKKKKPKQNAPQLTRSQVFESLSKIDAGAKVSERVQSVIAKMTAPPETIIDHLQRVGVGFILDTFSMNNEDSKPYLVIDYDDMVAKELENIKSGGFFKDEYPVVPAKSLGEALAPVVFDELKRRKEDLVAEANDITRGGTLGGEEVNTDDESPEKSKAWIDRYAVKETEDEYLQRLAEQRMANDSGARHSVAQVAEEFGIDIGEEYDGPVGERPDL